MLPSPVYPVNCTSGCTGSQSTPAMSLVLTVLKRCCLLDFHCLPEELGEFIKLPKVRFGREDFLLQFMKTTKFLCEALKLRTSQLVPKDHDAH